MTPEKRQEIQEALPQVGGNTSTKLRIASTMMTEKEAGRNDRIRD